MKRDITFVEELAPPARLVRVVKAAASVDRVDAWTKPDPVDLCLELWKNWMAGDSDRDLGAKTMRGLSGEGDGHGVDLHEAQQAHDIRIAQATNAAIDSMPRLHVWAIYRACSLTTVWRFPNASLMDVAAEARADLAVKLRKTSAQRCCSNEITLLICNELDCRQPTSKQKYEISFRYPISRSV